MDEQLARIRAKAGAKKITFCHCMTPDDVARWETQHGIVLPEGYRRFLLEVGNGRDGPLAFGVLRLGNIPNDLDAEQSRSWAALCDIEKPFPFTEPWVWEGEEYDPAKHASARHGSLNLGSDGCGLYYLLIVTGAERGNMWIYCDVGVVPLEPRRDFLGWIEAWLDEENHES